MKATKGSQHLIITLAKQHGFCVRLCCLLTLHCSICLHILQTQIPCLFCSFRIVVLMLVSTGFFSLFFRKKTTYNESNMIKNGTTVLDNYCEDILNQSWLKRRKKKLVFSPHTHVEHKMLWISADHLSKFRWGWCHPVCGILSIYLWS